MAGTHSVAQGEMNSLVNSPPNRVGLLPSSLCSSIGFGGPSDRAGIEENQPHRRHA